MKKITFILLILIFTGFFTACSTPPTEEMNMAQEAVARAENNADAVNFAGNTIIRARDALTRMQNEADAKRYDAAKNYAAEAIALAERAIEEGAFGAIRARDEALALINGLEDPLAETSSALEIAGQNGMDLDLAALSAEMDSARRTHDEARQHIQDDNYRDAIARGQDVRSTLSGINAAITDAAQAVSRKK